MEALDSNARSSRQQPHAGFLSAMIKTDTPPFSDAAVLHLYLQTQSNLTAAAQTWPPISNQAAARGKRNVVPSSRPSRRRTSSRALPLNVLVVDDVADVTEMIALFLKHAGYDVSTADSAAAALRIARERHFDVVISDIGMPEMNGYELAESLRASANYVGIPIIAVTGYSEYDDRGRALQAGFNAHLTKPIDPGRLLDLMKSLLDPPG